MIEFVSSETDRVSNHAISGRARYTRLMLALRRFALASVMAWVAIGLLGCERGSTQDSVVSEGRRSPPAETYLAETHEGYFVVQI